MFCHCHRYLQNDPLNECPPLQAAGTGGRAHTCLGSWPGEPPGKGWLPGLQVLTARKPSLPPHRVLSPMAAVRWISTSVLGGIFSSAHSARFTAHKAMWISEQADPAGSFPVVAEMDTSVDGSPKPGLSPPSLAQNGSQTEGESARALRSDSAGRCRALRLSTCVFLPASQGDKRNRMSRHPAPGTVPGGASGAVVTAGPRRALGGAHRDASHGGGAATLCPYGPLSPKAAREARKKSEIADVSLFSRRQTPQCTTARPFEGGKHETDQGRLAASRLRCTAKSGVHGLARGLRCSAAVT